MEKRAGKIDTGLIYLILILLAIGLVTVYSASHPEALFKFGDSFYYLKRQALAAILGIIGMLIMSKISYKFLRKFNLIYIGLSVLLTILTYIAGVEGGGAQRWISIFGFTFQSSEAIKVFGVLCMASFLDNNKRHNRNIKYGLFRFLLIAGFFTGLIVLQQDLSTAIILFTTFVIMFYIAGARYIHLLMIGGLGALGVLFLIAMYPYRIERFMAFRDPFSMMDKYGWQLAQSLYALGTGGLTGLGIGQSRQKFFYLPEAFNDFIFSIFGEEVGFIGCCLLILIFMVLIWKCISVASKSDTYYGKLMGVGFTSIIATQVLLHIAVVTSSVPPTGRALPFISAGGSSLLFLLGMMGIMLNISRYRR